MGSFWEQVKPRIVALLSRKYILAQGGILQASGLLMAGQLDGQQWLIAFGLSIGVQGAADVFNTRAWVKTSPPIPVEVEGEHRED